MIKSKTFRLVAILVLAGCGGEDSLKNVPPQNERVCCFGDSLVAGNGADTKDERYPNVLATLIDRDVTNWGVAGNTTTDGLRRIDRFASEPPFGVVIVTLGGNDLVRQLPLAETEKSLRAIFKRIQETGAVVVYTSVTSPVSLKRRNMYKRVCVEEHVLFIPNVLKGILTNNDLKADFLHPNGAGYKAMSERVAAALKDAGLFGTGAVDKENRE
jgi:acyl-CoA thioesterase-1